MSVHLETDAKQKEIFDDLNATKGSGGTFLKHFLDNDVPGMTCELGVFCAENSVQIMEAALAKKRKRLHIAVDPFGDIPYRHHENIIVRLDYDNIHKYRSCRRMAIWCEDNRYEHLFMPMEDTEFFKRFSDGVPFYNMKKYMLNQYAFVFFDGPHNAPDVRTEVLFFAERTPVGGVWVFDDTGQYPHMEKIHPLILSLGFFPLLDGHIHSRMAYKRHEIVGNLLEDTEVPFQLPKKCVLGRYRTEDLQQPRTIMMAQTTST